jgi:TRAP-type C4-dicarboxylate transport system permease small subunit
MVSVEVVLRKTVNITFGGADEISGYIFAISTSWALSCTLLHRGHIRIDLVYNYFAALGKAWLDILSLLSMACVGGMIAWYGYGVLERSYVLASKANTPLATPLWIPQAIWALGLLLFMWTLCLLLVLSLRAIATGQTGEVARLSGIPSTDDGARAALVDSTATTRNN